MRARLALLLSCTALMSTASLLHAASAGRPVAVKTVEKPLFGARLKPVRVRIGVEYQAFESVLTKGADGKALYKSVASAKVVHTLNSRLDQKNHFHFSGLHVETQPLSWNKESRKYRVRLDFYRTYGLHGELEEKLGSIVASGELRGQARRYNFLGSVTRDFKGPKGLKVAKITVGTPRIVKQPMISKIYTKDKK